MNAAHETLVRALERHAEALALPRGRRVGQPGHDVARDYLLGQMQGNAALVPFAGDSFELGYERPHPNTRGPQQFTNLVGVIPGKDRSLPPILLGAHYDSVIDAPCVDDNATSVAHNLVLAEHFAPRTLERDLVVAFFDAEEPPFFLGPCMGSRRFVEDHCRGRKFAAAIITDLVGHDATDSHLFPPQARAMQPHLGQLVAVMGMESDAVLPPIVEAAAAEIEELRVLALLHEHVGPMSDHAAFADAGHPFLFLSCGQGYHYHTSEDTMDWINFDKLARITRFIAVLVERIDRAPFDAWRGPVDPADTEARLLRKALFDGSALPPGLLSPPSTREELDAFIQGLLGGRFF